MSSKEANIMFKANELIKTQLKRELDQQGHNNTGALAASMTGIVKENGADIELEGYVLGYGLYVNFGVLAAKVPYGGASGGSGGGGGKSKYIQGLVTFFMSKGLSEKKALGAAFATAIKHKKEGIPTKDSYRYSRNGRRTDFIGTVDQAIDQKVDKIILDGYDNLIELTFQSTKSETL